RCILRSETTNSRVVVTRPVVVRLNLRIPLSAREGVTARRTTCFQFAPGVVLPHLRNAPSSIRCRTDASNPISVEETQAGTVIDRQGFVDVGPVNVLQDRGA